MLLKSDSSNRPNLLHLWTYGWTATLQYNPDSQFIWPVMSLSLASKHVKILCLFKNIGGGDWGWIRSLLGWRTYHFHYVYKNRQILVFLILINPVEMQKQHYVIIFLFLYYRVQSAWTWLPKGAKYNLKYLDWDVKSYRGTSVTNMSQIKTTKNTDWLCLILNVDVFIINWKSYYMQCLQVITRTNMSESNSSERFNNLNITFKTRFIF